MPLFLDASIDQLQLSRRVRNALHLAGLHTLGSVLACDYKTSIRGFGRAAKAELMSALETSGFALPPRLVPPGSDSTQDEIAHLLAQMEESFQTWGARLEHFEMRLRAFTASSPSQYEAPEQVLACRALAHQFRVQLTSFRTITGALREIIELPPEQHELVDLLEEQSVRLSVLVYRLLEMFAAEESLSNSQRQKNGGSDAREGCSGIISELAAGCGLLLQVTGKASGSVSGRPFLGGTS